MTTKAEIERLKRALRDLHGVEGTHVRSEPVHETFYGQTVWEGVVEVFTITGCADATTAYVWSHETDSGGRRFVAILGVDPIKRARDAVRAAVVAAAVRSPKA